jgi:hypothetical protein
MLFFLPKSGFSCRALSSATTFDEVELTEGTDFKFRSFLNITLEFINKGDFTEYDEAGKAPLSILNVQFKLV